MVISLERGANDLHMVQLMPLPPHHLLLQWNPEWFTFHTSLKNVNRLQGIQHSLARVVTRRHSRALPSAAAFLKQLHWLPIEWRIWFKLATLTFKALHTGRPPYLTD